MTEQASHWPFDKDAHAHKKGDEQQSERERREASVRKHARFDRFLTGGRAHVKKHGLS